MQAGNAMNSASSATSNMKFNMKVRYVLLGKPRDISQREDTFEFDNEIQIVVTSRFAKAIEN